jgi:thymidylate synthase
MNKLDKDYLELVKDILVNGTKKMDRTGTGTLSVFGRQIRHKMSEGFPLLTTKKMHFKGIVTELLWFLRSDTNIKFLLDNNCHIWNGDCYKNYCKTYQNQTPTEQYSFDTDPMTQTMFIEKIKTNSVFAEKWGNLGKIYGYQWRKWTKYLECGYEPHLEEPIDQIANLINDLKTNPDSRRLLVTAWNPSDYEEQVLPPCHIGFQVYTRELSEKERLNTLVQNDQRLIYEEVQSFKNLKKKTVKDFLDKKNVPTRAISLMWNQRSVDVPLGLPYNISSYSILLKLLSELTNMIPEEVIGNLGDCHIYLNQVDGIKEQLLREPYELPTVSINTELWGKSSDGSLSSEHFLESLQNEDFCKSLINDDIKLVNYVSHPTIKLPLSN